MVAKTLMVQGTTSDAGKSTLVAALCRIFYRRNIAVVPFKPQNMALNSAVTVDGGEIGRAQALQAQAAGLEPVVDMNPILLKPTTDRGAQVIIHGKVHGQMDAAEYHTFKKQAMTAVLESHQRLQAQYKLIIVEGAGSPAEINLRDNDIANMGFAEAVDCPVILVADIDRGGVFAHIVGTLELLSESERKRVIGFVINRFRGDIKLLQPGLDWLTEYTGKPVLGVIPYLHGLHLDGEDGINPISGLDKSAAQLKVVVPRLPRISNHTDFDPLRLHPQVDFHYIKADQSIPPADVIILPGSKNTISDLRWLKQQGWEEVIKKHLRYGGKVIGICGGFQMLGETLVDDLGIEGEPGEEAGFNLLPMSTHLRPEKQLHRRQGFLLLNGDKQVPVSGYEIHAGISVGDAFNRPLVALTSETNEAGLYEGAMSDDGNVLGSYLHGFFDQPEALESLLAWAGLEKYQTFDYIAYREQAIDRLSEVVEKVILDLPNLMLT